MKPIQFKKSLFNNKDWVAFREDSNLQGIGKTRKRAKEELLITEMFVRIATPKKV